MPRQVDPIRGSITAYRYSSFLLPRLLETVAIIGTLTQVFKLSTFFTGPRPTSSQTFPMTTGRRAARFSLMYVYKTFFEYAVYSTSIQRTAQLVVQGRHRCSCHLSLLEMWPIFRLWN
jgi:hypothetical protein